jgi:integrase
MTDDQLALTPNRELAESDSRLRALEQAADVIVDATVVPNTKRAFDQDWATWEQFCAREGVAAATVSSGLLVAFATWLAHSTGDSPAAAPATITRRLSGVLDGWCRRDLVVPQGITKDARKVITAYQRALAEANIKAGRGAAPALTVPHLRQISAALPDTLAGIRDRAIVVVGFGMAARRSEVANLLVEDVTVTDDGLSIVVRHSKTGHRSPAVPFGTDPGTCPVRTWLAWRTASGIVTGPAFRSIDRHGNLGTKISAHSVGQIVTRAGVLAGLDLHFTGHSVRSGLATEARRAGHDAKTIAAQGGWRPNSATLYGYMQVVDRWSDNAVRGIGL